MTPSLFISCAEALEPLLYLELEELGIEDLKKGFRGVFAPRTLENVFKINYLSRLATRVLWPLASFRCPDKEALYAEAKKIPWLDFLDESQTFAIDSNVSHPNLRNSLFAAQVVKDAICDQIREKRGGRPSVDIKNPDVQLNLFIHQTQGFISLDTSGAPLYKRGWSVQPSGDQRVEATLPETLAAALLVQAGYSAKDTFCDPFCGSGTLLIEAALIASKTPPGYYRKKWGFFHLPEFDEPLWERFKNRYNADRIPLSPGKIIGADRDFRAIALCTEQVKRCGFEEGIELIKTEIGNLQLPFPPTLIVTDPPFGKRMETSPQLFYQLGKFVRGCTPPPRTFVLSPSIDAVRATGCPTLSAWPLKHGGIPLSLYRLKL